jgi:hypothetical protein
MTREEFQQYYEGEVLGLEKRRYHLLMPLNIRTFESQGWKYTWMDQNPDGWVFWGSEGKKETGDGERTFRVHVPKTGDEFVWEWDWEWKGESVAIRAQKGQ